MRSAEAQEEHFVTLFDRNFLAAGLCLYRSLKEHAGAFRLWIVCMDEVVERRLRELELPEVRLLPLAEVETAELRRVRGGRSVGEYCWTLTPFTPGFVMDRAPEARRVTYLDADLYFFGAPRLLLEELEAAEAHVLITPHAYSPEYDQSADSGIYCVQFVTFCNSAAARAVLRWWQERCIEWCYNRVEDGKFGDQKYLDDWPERFAGCVHVLRRAELALGPWNANRFIHDERFLPAFFHFHGVRVVSEGRLLLYCNYRLRDQARRLYDRYVAELTQVLGTAYARWGEIPGTGLRPGLKERLWRLRCSLRGASRYADLRIGRSRQS
jgi:hypothetical protein